MAQKTNLNVSPYFDDFLEKDQGARDKNYYKVLFNPGKPIQARELNTLQSILQNQVETFGSHIFKEGSVVIPGNIVYDNQFYSVKLNPQQYNVEISSYLSEFVGKKITGQISGVTATIQFVQLPNSEIEYPTIYVKYLDSDVNFQVNQFQDNEQLYASEIIGTITSGTPFATTISTNSTAIGSAASIGEGIYFIRGSFVKVEKQTIILDYYTNSPSYRVGLRIDEKIITPKDDSSLYDNAKGFTNFAAPGADRFQISLVLTKKLIEDVNDTDFVELLRVREGAIKKIDVKSSYSLIKDYLAQRTYDESGDYVVDPFQFSIHNSLNDALGNDGIYFSNEKTDQGNTPSDNLMCIKLSPGKAYVRGYDIEKTGVEILDVAKPRTTESRTNINIPFEMGNLIRINNVSGAPLQKQTVDLYNYRKSSTTTPSGTKIGDARIYTFSVTDSAYSGNSTNWDLYLFDIQTYTEIQLNKSLSGSELPLSSFIKGKSSGASGYATAAGSGSDRLFIRQTSGTFIVNEQILINGVETYPRSIKNITTYSSQDIKSVYQSTSVSGFSTAFLADTQLDKIIPTGFSPTDTITIESNGNVSSSGKIFTGISSGAIIRYQRVGFNTETYNRVATISSDKTTITLSGISTVSGICDGSLPVSQTTVTFSVGSPRIRNQQSGFLYAELPNTNISSTNLTNSNLVFTAQSAGTLTPSGGSLVLSPSNFTLGVSTSISQFEPYDEERYSIHYADGTIEPLSSDKVVLFNNQLTFNNIQNKNISVINATFVKNGIQNKVKKFNRSQSLSIDLSKNVQSGTGINTSINDGLTYNSYYGLRVQDEEICLRYPDVAKIIAVYESLDTSNPVLDTLTFSSTVNVDTNAIIGENIRGKQSKAVARIVSKPSSNTLGVVYLNNNKFFANENVYFEESNIDTTIDLFTAGRYKNITNKFILDKAQKDQYYDYSRLVRKKGESEPTNKILAIFDYYSIPSNDTGDVFTVNSYESERFNSDVPFIGINNVRASDTLDFRPRVSVFTGSSSSPFDFSSRSFTNEPKVILTPNESSLVSYDFYLGRIDKLYLNKLGQFIVSQGTPSVLPTPPPNPSEVIELCTINLPPYLYNPRDAIISLVDNRRYTMRDIGLINNRVKNLERVTSLSLLELNTQTLQIQDAQGFNRFKTGFFVDDFKNYDLMNNLLTTAEIDEDTEELSAPVGRNSINLLPVSAEVFTNEDLDLNKNFTLYDSNVQKTGDAITLKYESVGWIEQPLATRVENVNPFNVVSYNGVIKLNPESDSWVRSIRLEDILVTTSTTLRITPGSAQRWINNNNAQPVFTQIRIRRRGLWGWLFNRRRTVSRLTGAVITNEEEEVFDGEERFMRSRNTGFYASNLRPLTRFYQFLDGESGVDFIPKLIEISSDSNLQNYGSSGAFQVGETVVGSFNDRILIRFRVATSNHKEGPFNSPSTTYNINPYKRNENIPASYSSSSNILNVDIESLCQQTQGLYSGYLIPGMKLVGTTSGSIAYVKDLRLVSDNYGDLFGSFFLRDPNTIPPPATRVNTGAKVYKLTSSENNETPLPGSALISSGETIYRSTGRWEQRQRTITTQNIRFQFVDPLAQSFTVGGNIEDVNGNIANDDTNGVYLTAVDLFFASKDSGNTPLTVEVRTVELGTPTKTILAQVTLRPDQITTSRDATVATKVTFDYPVYLSPGLQYAIALLSPQSDQYEVWIAEMGQKTVNTSTLPDAESVRYTKQFAVGRLYKSQNGAEWTPNDYQDMKFKLYKANFTSTSGSILFQNPSLNESNGYVPTLTNNPVKVLPRKLIVGITTVTNSGLLGILTTGRKISGSGAADSYKYGYITGTGSSVSSISLTSGGSNYSNTSAVQTYSISGNGSGLTLNITATNGSVGVATVVNPGNGYAVGDIVGIVTSSVSTSTGRDAIITISTISGLDTLYLSNVQGNDFTDNISLVYYDNSGNAVSLASTLIKSSVPVGGIYGGNVLEVSQFEHGMHASNNKVILDNIESNIAPGILISPINISDTSISLASTANFTTFEGYLVDSNNPGYVKVGNEIIKYVGTSNNQLISCTRGFDSTTIQDHSINTPIYKYELSGVSLRRINTTHNISNISGDIDKYYLEFDRSVNGVDRSSDNNTDSTPQLCFNSEYSGGGNQVTATQNIQYDTIIPQISSVVPSSLTDISTQVRTVSGTSAGGNEISFQDLGYENVEIGSRNKLSSTRIICSNVNEITYLNGSLLQNRSKSLILKVNLSTSDNNLSPLVFWKDSSVVLLSNSLNNPISDYINDGRVNSINDDPHSAVYVSNTIRLEQPASSLKVLLSAYRPSSADFRVLYSLIRPDSSEIEQAFELFPGYNNLTIDSNQDGYLDVVDPSQNSGLPDVFVPASLENQFLEYEFTASNLGDFTGYTIKIVMSGTDQSNPPRFADLRSIAVK
jgi:hypothetical protein